MATIGHGLDGNSSANGAENEEMMHYGDAGPMETPVHPIPSLQRAFEESISESMEEQDIPFVPVEADARARRHQLLESSSYDDRWTSRWNQRASAQYHPLLKLMAQIVFGMHLLQQQQAKSEKEVVKILQTHVNEVDTFLERTADDFDVAIKDVEDRLRHLRLPMTHLDVFETMLNDAKFRTQLLTGNEKITRIMNRTTVAMNASLLDVEKGVQANRELHRYMRSVQDRWPSEQRAIADVFGAMRGNEQGWKRYMKDLQHKGTTLTRLLAALQKLIAEMSAMAATASRRTRTQSGIGSNEAKSVPSTPVPTSKYSQEEAAAAAAPAPTSPQSSHQRRTSNLNKPLPIEPAAVASNVRDSTAKAHPVPFAERYERPRQSPPEPIAPLKPAMDSMMNRPRPKTAGATSREARAADARVNPSELLSFLQRPDPLRSNPNPLRSNPPSELEVASAKTSSEHVLARSSSQGTNIIMSAVSVNHEGAKVMRTKSHGTLNPLNLQSGHSVNLSHSSQHASNDFASRTNGAGGWLPAIEDHTERRAAMKNTGFARRLSKRLKHLPLNMDAPLKSPPLRQSPLAAPSPIAPTTTATTATTATALLPQDQHQPTPPDSAYASLKDKDSPPNETQGTFVSNNRPESVVGPLPLPFLNTYKYNNNNHHNDDSSSSGANGEARRSGSSTTGIAPSTMGIAPSTKSLASAKSRALSLKNAFRSKWSRSRPSVVAA